MRPIVVEFLGLPGVGKTSASLDVADRLRERGLRVEIATAPVGHNVGRPRRAYRKVVLAALEGLAHPARAIRYAVAVLRSGQRSLPEAGVRILNWLAIQRLMARGGGDIRILDHGALQELWSGSLFARTTSDLQQFAQEVEWQRPDVVVMLAAEASVVRDRLAARSSTHSRLQRVAPADVAPIFARADRLLEEVPDWVGSRHPISWMFVDGAQSRPAIADAVAKSLWPLVPARVSKGRGT